MTLIQNAHKKLSGIDPVPAEAQELHTAIVSATTDCDAMTYAVADGLDSLNAAKLEQATKLMQSCSTKIVDGQPIMQELAERYT